MNNKYALIVIGYNRIPGMLRLLRSLNAADYLGDKVTLIISLDNCGGDEVKKAAEAFHWNHGDKRIRTFSERQGLRKHILSCGAFLSEFEAIAVFEDDLYVAPGFYNYMKQTVELYKSNADVAGISLYSHKTNTNIQMPFVAQPSQYDVFFMQFAQSWGQVWMKEQWLAFQYWYESNHGEDLSAGNFPDCVANWPESSWLKYHIKYCVETSKYFVYPYDSLTTCFSDAGEHSKETNTVFQVPIIQGTNRCYKLPSTVDLGIRYNVFYERDLTGLKIKGIPANEITMDLYGSIKSHDRRYLLTSRQLPYKVVESYGRILKPHEANVLFDIEGDDFYLYDTQSRNIKKNHEDKAASEVSYYFNITATWKSLLKYVIARIKRKRKNKK